MGLVKYVLLYFSFLVDGTRGIGSGHADVRNLKHSVPAALSYSPHLPPSVNQIDTTHRGRSKRSDAVSPLMFFVVLLNLLTVGAAVEGLE